MFSSLEVGTNHPDYISSLPVWQRCRTCVAGEDAVKAAGEQYLPRLSEQTEPEYQAYKARASFVPATKRVVLGMSGLITQKDPTVAVGEAHQYLVDSFASTGESLAGMSRYVVRELCTTGRLGLLIDKPVDASGRAHCSTYTAESIVNWRTIFVEGELVLQFVVFEEEISIEGSSFLSHERTLQRRVCYLDPATYVYSVDVYVKNVKSKSKEDVWQLQGETIVPTILGKKLVRIPFILITPTSSGVDMAIDDGPVSDLAGLNLSHYRTSADLEHGRHFTALPTAWVAGFSADTNLVLGSAVAWVSQDVNARAGFLEFTGAGLGALQSGLKEKWDHMISIGSRILETTKASVEAADTLKIRRESENTVISMIVQSVEAGVNFALMYVLAWSGATSGGTVTFNREFYTDAMDAATLGAINSAYITGGLSFPAYFHLMQQGRMYPEGWTIEDEAGALMLGTPSPTATAGTG